MADANRDDDSGLHDIRSLASSTKLRMSKRMPSVPGPSDDDILASSSAGWKNVALPEPARMVSLPDISQLPSAADVKAQQKADKAAEKASRKSARDLTAGAEEAVAAAPVAAVDSPSKATAPVIGARFAKPVPVARNNNTLYAVAGIAIAAAAGVGIFLKVSSNKAAAPQQVAVAPAPVPERAPAPAPTAPVAAATATPIEPTPAPPPVVEPVVVADADPASYADSKHKATKPASKKAAGSVGFSGDDLDSATTKGDKAAKSAPGAGSAAPASSDPSFDALLKEAGVQDKKPTAPTLEKKSLSSGDIRTAMSAVDAKAKACYSGTQGSASVKLTVAPSGKITKISIAGVFKGTPTAACVESAVRDATFPPWDGGPQSVSYAYLLAE